MAAFSAASRLPQNNLRNYCRQKNNKAFQESKMNLTGRIQSTAKNGYSVIPTHIKYGNDFLKFEPTDYDIIITNPPYSLKNKFLERAFSLKKPFLFLLPITTLEGLNRGKMFRENWEGKDFFTYEPSELYD